MDGESEEEVEEVEEEKVVDRKKCWTLVKI